MGLTARKTVSKAPSSADSARVLGEGTNRIYDNSKRKKKSNFPIILLGGIALLSLAGFLLNGGEESISKRLHTRAANVRRAQQNEGSTDAPSKDVSDKNVSKNPYEGWQPVPDWTQDEDNKQCQSIRTCFKEGHSCPAKCSDSLTDFGKAPPRPGYTFDPDLSEDENMREAQQVPWVPDVTVLRRMAKAGKDEHGNPWPPPLVTETNKELCEKIGTFGGVNDDHMTLINKVPIRGMDLLEEWDAAKLATKKMNRQPKILCMVYTMEKNHHTNIRTIRETWGPGCDGFLAFSTKDDPRLPAISLPHDGPEEYENMWQKVRSIWRFVGTHYLEDFDFFFQGGEDLYVLPQNLRSVLADLVTDPTTEDFFGGRRFQWGKKSNVFFNSGGAGYALSQATLRKYVTEGLDHPKCFPNKHSSMEDVFIARCLKDAFGIGVVDTRDAEERERFHPFGPAGHYNWRPPANGKRDWYQDYNMLWPPKLKEQCCAPDSVSFHYLKKPAMVRHIHALLYFCD